MSSPHDPPSAQLGCEAARAAGRAFRRGQLPAEEHAAVANHLAGCSACRALFAEESSLDAALDEHLPRFAAPAALKSRLAVSWGAGAGQGEPTSSALSASGVAVASATRRATVPRRWWPRGAGGWMGAAAVGALAAWAVLAWRPGSRSGLGETSLVVAEAVNDHLRIVQSSHPVEIESGGIHQVKPWFTGKLDFAPPVTFSGDDEFPLVGGSVGYFIDRKAAVMTFKHRLHVLTLLIVPQRGLAWPIDQVTTSRGFRLRFWAKDDLGFVLISDASAETLASLAQRLETQ